MYREGIRSATTIRIPSVTEDRIMLTDKVIDECMDEGIAGEGKQEEGGDWGVTAK